MRPMPTLASRTGWKEKWKRHWPLLLILLAALLVYLPVLRYDFVNLDDPLLVYENPRVLTLTLGHLRAIFTSYDPELYIPLTLVSFQVENALLGLAPWHFHLVNLLLHLSSTTLVYFLTLKLSKQISIAAIATLLFALHPINVETVTWVSGRKDLLSSFFFLASLVCYLLYTRRSYQDEISKPKSPARTRFGAGGQIPNKHQIPGPKRTARRSLLLLSLLLFLFALLSKASVIMLPLVLLLIDWQLGERAWRSSLKRSFPFFALSLLFGLIALGGKSHNLSTLSLTDYPPLAAKATVFYLGKLLWPTNLSVVYPQNTAVLWSAPEFLVPMILVVILTAIVIALRWRVPFLIFASVFFLLNLLPAFLTFVKRSDIDFASERYMYLPAIGIWLLVATLIAGQAKDDSKARSGRARRLYSTVVASGILLIVLGTMSVQRLPVWHDSIVFNRDIIAHDPQAYHAYYNLGYALEQIGQSAGAEAAYEQAIAANPAFGKAHMNLGILRAKQGKLIEAVTLLTEAVKLTPHTAKAHYNLGVAYQWMRDWDRAILSYRRAIEINPNDPEVHRNLATMYGEKKMFAEAIEEYKALAELDPIFAETLKTLPLPQRR